jgi:hypothetical protein
MTPLYPICAPRSSGGFDLSCGHAGRWRHALRLLPAAEAAAGLLDLPWDRPLEEWADPRIVEVRQRGISRHIVRFAEEGGVVYALKEITPELARKEYQLLRRLTELQLPVVEVLGVVVDRPHDLDAVLVTKYLDYSVSYRALFSNPRGAEPVGRLLDALVELIARLHLAGFYWGDCSLSNTLFRLDAGALSAYLVDAETGELYPSLSPKQREYDVFLASTNVGGELMDLEAGGLLPRGSTWSPCRRRSHAATRRCGTS